MRKYEGALSWRLERLAPWLVLAFLSFFIYAKFFLAPYAGFRFAVPDGEVVEVFVVDGGLRLGDHLLQMGAVSWTDFAANPLQTLFENVSPGDEVPLQINRSGQFETVIWMYPGPTLEEALQRLNGLWWLSYVFWLAGTVTFLLVRPRDITWRLMVAFNYLTATWLAAGSVSLWHISLSAYVLVAAIWFCVPVYLQLHWLFPRPLTRLPAIVGRGAYLLTALLVVAGWQQRLPRGLEQYAYLLALLASLLLVLFRLLWRPEERGQVSLLAAAMLLAIVPPLLMGAATAAGVAISPLLLGGALLALPAIPGAYFYTVYRRQLDPRLQPRANRLAFLYLLLVLLVAVAILGLAFVATRVGVFENTLLVGVALTILVAAVVVVSFAPFLVLPALASAYVPPAREASTQLEFRANRLITPVLFFVLLATLATTFFLLLFAWLDYPEAPVGVTLVAVMLTSLVALVSYRPFQQLVERKLLGIPVLPAELIATYAARITTSLDRSSLASLLTDEVFRSLSLRQAAILLSAGSSDGAPFVNFGVSADELPAEADVSRLLAESQGETYASPGDNARQLGAWVRLVLPLAYGDKVIGVWLLGRRDPDDLYSQAEIPLFQTLANQTAVALTNITMTEDLQALYREDIDRHESERVRLARALHDEVLNELAVLGMFMENPGQSGHFQEAYDKLLAHLRLLIGGLRPAMLQYGLQAALEELVDELAERAAGSAEVRLDLPLADVRYPERVERHVFRIVQLAVNNALKHARAQTIRIAGRLEPGLIKLSVADDGAGFPAGKQLDLPTLLAEKHFGLAGMHERAALLGATLAIDSAPGRGTQVVLHWQETNKPQLSLSSD